MAKKRKGKRKSHRRRRVGAVHPGIMNLVTNAAGIVVGAVGAAFVNSAIKKSMATAPAFTGGGIAVAAGAALPYFVRGNTFVQSVGNGMIAAGGLFALNETFLSVPGISGLPSMPGLNNSGPGFIRKTVGRAGNRTRQMGKLDNLAVVGALTSN